MLMGQMGLLVLGTLFAEGTVYRTLPGLRRELEASYSSRALLMSWRAFRTVRQADLVRLQLISNTWALALPCSSRFQCQCHPSAFNWSGAGQAERRQWAFNHSAGSGT